MIPEQSKAEIPRGISDDVRKQILNLYSQAIEQQMGALWKLRGDIPGDIPGTQY